MRTICDKARGLARTQGRLEDRALGLHPIEEEKAIDRLAKLALSKGVPRTRVRTAEEGTAPIASLVRLTG